MATVVTVKGPDPQMITTHACDIRTDDDLERHIAAALKAYRQAFPNAPRHDQTVTVKPA